MTEQRTVTIHINAVQKTQIIETITGIHTAGLFELLTAIQAYPGDVDTRQQYKVALRVTPWKEYYAAIGNLSSWNMTFPTVDIYPDTLKDDNTDLIAVYKREDGSVGYTLAAIWHGDYYGFHS